MLNADLHAPVLLYGSIQFDVPSTLSGRTYRIFVFKPPAPPPSSGYPVVVVTAETLMFPLAATMGAACALEREVALLPLGNPLKSTTSASFAPSGKRPGHPRFRSCCSAIAVHDDALSESAHDIRVVLSKMRERKRAERPRRLQIRIAVRSRRP